MRQLLLASAALVTLAGSACGSAVLTSSEARREHRDCHRLADSDACAAVAERLFSGDGAAEDVDRAVALAARACRLDSSSGCAYLGELALRLEDPERAQDAVDALERACARYETGACDVLMLTYAAADSPNPNLDRAEAIRQRLCDDGFTWHCWVDADGDRIHDDSDACPTSPEDRDAFEDEDGCPEPDNDQDGVLDETDACPQDHEDADGHQDEDGCPDPDNDEDAIVDGADACANVAEDTDSFEDEDGCPDPDNDRDGLIDVSDACPDAAEDFDGFEDPDGCPEEGSGLVTLTCAQIEIREAVYFETNSDVIEERSFTLLDQVAGVLSGAVYITLAEVAGHTDDRGNDAANLELSERRAASVVRYLVEAGVAPARIRSAGYGETLPIQPNTTADGRAANRRVEFRIVEQSSACGEGANPTPADAAAPAGGDAPAEPALPEPGE